MPKSFRRDCSPTLFENESTQPTEIIDGLTELRLQQGFTVIPNSIINSSLWKMRLPVRVLGIHFIIVANFEPKPFNCIYQKKPIVIGRGEYIFEGRKLANEVGLTHSVFRSAYANLLDANFLNDITPKVVKLAHGYTHIKITKYDTYSTIDNYCSHTINSRLAHTKDTKTINNPKIPTPNPNIKEFLDYASKTYISRFNGKLQINRSIDPAGIKRLLKEIPYEELIKRWDTFLSCNGENGNYYRSQGYSISCFIATRVQNFLAIYGREEFHELPSFEDGKSGFEDL